MSPRGMLPRAGQLDYPTQWGNHLIAEDPEKEKKKKKRKQKKPLLPFIG